MTNKALTANKSRQDKVAMVKGLLSGKASLSEYRPYKCLVWYHTDEYYTLEDGSLKLTEQEYRDYCEELEKRYRLTNLIMIDCSTPKQATA